MLELISGFMGKSVIFYIHRKIKTMMFKERLYNWKGLLYNYKII